MKRDIPFFQGSGFYLRELRESDLSGNWYQWFNDSSVTALQNKKTYPNTIERQRQYYEALGSSTTDVVLAMIENNSQTHFGNVGLHKIDYIHRSAELGIVIGEKEFRGRGFGKQAWKMMTEYGFDVLNLHRLYSIVMEGNSASMACAESAGFKKEGYVRDMFFKEGKYLSAYYLNALRSERPA